MAHILVVDDEKNIRKMVRLTLQKSGHQVEAAEAGPEALDRFAAGAEWDLVLLDQRMPGMQGLDVMRAMRRRDATARIVMITAFSTTELALDAIKSGATDFLRKPFSAESLRGAVKVALTRSLERAPTDEDPLRILKLALPGASTPLVSFYLNGYQYWQIAATCGTAAASGFTISRLFQVQGPGGGGPCTVGLLPHVEAVIMGLAPPGHMDDSLWDSVCQIVLSNYLWVHAELPPATLPVYELSDGQLHSIRRAVSPERA